MLVKFENSIFLFIILTLFAACPSNQINKLEISNSEDSHLKFDEEHGFQKIEYSDAHYSSNLKYTTHDTITSSGYSIEYFVVDTTKYDDLYIVWGNQLFKDTFECPGILMLDDYEYIPSYSHETDDFLVFKYYCAQMGCNGGVYLPKNPKKDFYLIEGILMDFINPALVLYHDGLSTSPKDTLYAYDLSSKKKYKIPFETPVDFEAATLKNKLLTVVGSAPDYGNKIYIRTISLE